MLRFGELSVNRWQLAPLPNIHLHVTDMPRELVVP